MKGLITKSSLETLKKKFKIGNEEGAVTRLKEISCDCPVSKKVASSFLMPNGKPSLFWVHDSGKLIFLPLSISSSYRDYYMIYARVLVLFCAYDKWNYDFSERTKSVRSDDERFNEKCNKLSDYLRSLTTRISKKNWSDFYSDDGEVIEDTVFDLFDNLDKSIQNFNI